MNGASLSEICFALLIGSNFAPNAGTHGSKAQNNDNSVWSPSNVTLAGMTPKLEQLQEVTYQLTHHVGLLASCDWLQRYVRVIVTTKRLNDFLISKQYLILG